MMILLLIEDCFTGIKQPGNIQSLLCLAKESPFHMSRGYSHYVWWGMEQPELHENMKSWYLFNDEYKREGQMIALKIAHEQNYMVAPYTEKVCYSNYNELPAGKDT